MTDLMTHVESIVRPVRATQSRKLRMRHELLAHLQSALAEETALNPTGALDRAKHRLGEPAALTAQLQQTVPAIERLLMSHLPTPRAYDDWERRAFRRIWGTSSPMTFAHAALLTFSALCLPYAALLFIAFRAGHPSTYQAALINHPAASLAFSLFFTTATLLLILSAGRLITSTARRRSPLPHVLMITVLLTLALPTCVLGLARRPLSPADFLTLAAVLPSLLLSLLLTGHLLGTLFRRYDDWLALTPPSAA